jgi:selenocysteine-specific elongation factor
MYVLGTAGHVDHGKSSLLRALTAMEPDRLPEEKKRGMTIDLNFLWLTLAEMTVGVVDVPGHHRYVKNMMSGAAGIDGYLFVVAADDGWMPQSEEHFQVLEALGIEKGIVIISKVDLVSEERVVALESELRARFGHSHIYRFTRDDEASRQRITEAVRLLVEKFAPPREVGTPRLWVDRVFVPKGIGVVVTGTLREGSLGEGDEVTIYPANHKATVKSLQAYQSSQTRVSGNSRVAVQLSGVKADEIDRGALIQKPEQARGASTTFIEARLRWLGPPPTRPTRLSFHVGTLRVPARVILLSKDNFLGWARLRFESPIWLRSGDRFLLRTPGDESMLGSGIVVEPCAKRDKVANALLRLSRWRDSIEGWLDYLFAKYGIVHEAEAVRLAGYSEAEITRALNSDKHVALQQGVYAARGELGQWWEAIKGELQSRGPAAEAVVRGRLSEMFGIERSEELLTYWRSQNQLKWEGGQWSLVTHQADPAQTSVLARVRQIFQATPGQPVCLKELSRQRPEKEIIGRLVRENVLIALADDHYLDPPTYDAAKTKVKAFLAKRASATTSELREMLGLSRKFVVMILEKMDRDRVTYLKDGVRKLLRPLSA